MAFSKMGRCAKRSSPGWRSQRGLAAQLTAATPAMTTPEVQYDRLADLLRSHLVVPALFRLAGLRTIQPVRKRILRRLCFDAALPGCYGDALASEGGAMTENAAVQELDGVWRITCPFAAGSQVMAYFIAAPQPAIIDTGVSARRREQ